MVEDRVVPGAWWSDERLAGLPPAGRLGYLRLSADADRDGFVAIDLKRLARDVGVDEGRGGTILILLDTFKMSVSYVVDGEQFAWLPEFPASQPTRGNYKIVSNFKIPPPSIDLVKSWVSDKLSRVATERECKDSCPRAFGSKKMPRTHEYDHSVQEVWMAWSNRQAHPERCKLTDATQRIIRGALKQASHQDLISVVRYAYESDEGPARFWRGENSDKRKYLGLDNLFRATKLQGRLQMVLEWKARKDRSASAVRSDEVDLGPFARRSR